MDVPPPTKRWHTREDSGLRLDRQGRWWHDDEPLDHPKIVEAFNQGLEPSDDGRFVLRFGADWAYVKVEDAAYRVVAVDLPSPSGPEAGLRLSDRTFEVLKPETLALDDEGVLVCRVKQGRATARFSRDAQYSLGALLEDVEGAPLLRVGARTYRILPRAPVA